MPVCNYQGLLVACGDSLLHMWVVPATHIQNLRIAYGSKESNTSKCTMPEKSLRLEERDGVANPLETVSIIKSLQRTLNTVEVELTKCPETD